MRSRVAPRKDDAGSAATARRDLLIGAILIASAILLLGTGWRTLDALATEGTAGANLMLTGLLLNVAIVIFGWSRYRQLARALAARDDAETRAHTLARTDELTGFLNRRAFAEEAAGLIRQHARRDRGVAMLVLDLDHFKTVNEVHGHLAGDAVLREAAETLRRSLPPGAIAGRLDGDEFALLAAFDTAHAATIDALADYIVGRLAQPIAVGGVVARTGATIGIARSDDDCTTVDALLRRANIAMHAAKSAGRGRHGRFDATMERELIQRNAIEAGLREGIPAGQFVPYYEQQVDLATGRLIGFEVLARWDHPTQGLVAPDAFIPIAEETGLIADLSIAVMRRAFVEARDWDPSLTLSVNISPAQLKDPWLAQKIVKLLVETGYPANRLEIEITESGLFQNLSLAQSVVGSLKNQGIRLSLDDFGTGYSSLSHLRALPFDRIKIDRSFVMSMMRDPESEAIVNAISRLGQSLHLPITAEGIENQAIAARLRDIGCNKGQGWLYGKPMAIGAARRLLAERGLLPSARMSAEATETQSRVRRVG